MTGGVLILLIGLTFMTGVFCLSFALYRLTTLAGPTNVTPLPVKPTDEEQDAGPKLTKLGRPIQEVRLRA